MSSEEITVVVNEKEETIPADFGSTPEELAMACHFDPDSKHYVYRTDSVDDGATLTEQHRCSEPLVVDDGDEFVIVPKHMIGA